MPEIIPSGQAFGRASTIGRPQSPYAELNAGFYLAANQSIAAQNAATLEGLGQQTGAISGGLLSRGVSTLGSVGQAGLGVGARILDILGRPSYTIAGMVDEAVNNNGDILDIVGRGANEFFSGMLGFQGQKETFSEVLEGAGWTDPTTLADVVPVVDNIPLIGRVLGGLSTRGAAGLALDVAFDPLTWLGGIGAARRLATAGRESVRVVEHIVEAGRLPRARYLQAAARQDPALSAEGQRVLSQLEDKFRRATQNTAARALEQPSIKELGPELLDIGRFAPEERSIIRREARQVAVRNYLTKLDEKLAGGSLDITHRTKLQADLLEAINSTAKGGPDLGFLGGFDKKVGEQFVHSEPGIGQFFGFEDLSFLKAKEVGQDAKVLRQALGLEDLSTRAEVFAEIKKGIDIERKGLISGGLRGDTLLIAQDLSTAKAMRHLAWMAQDAPELLMKPGVYLNLPFAPKMRLFDSPVQLMKSLVNSSPSQRTYNAMKDFLGERFPGMYGAIQKSAEGSKKFLDWTGRLFNRDWYTRNVAGYNILKQAHLDFVYTETTNQLDELFQSPLAQWAKTIEESSASRAEKDAVYRRFANDIENGVKGEADARGKALDWFRSKNEQIATIEARAGLLTAPARPNYFAHFYNNSPEELNGILSAYGRVRTDLATVGRHNEERTFKTLEEAVQFGKALGKEVRPIYDPLVVMKNRLEAHVDGLVHNEWYDVIKSQFADNDTARQFLNGQWNLTQNVSDAVRDKISAIVSGTGKVERKVVDSFSDEEKKEFFRQTFETMQTPAEFRRLIRQHGDLVEYFPRPSGVGHNILDPYGRITLQGISDARLPLSIRKDLQEMALARRGIEYAALREFVRYTDAWTNTLKLSLTSIFPSFHFRNGLANIAQMFGRTGFAALDPRLHRMATGILAYHNLGRDLAPTPLRNRITGELIEMKQLHQEMLSYGVVQPFENVLEVTGDWKVKHLSPVRLADKAAPMPKRMVNALRPILGEGVRGLARPGLKLGGFIENEARMAMYLAMRRDGLNALEAANEVKKVLFDYAALSIPEREFFKRVIPFWVWTKKNIALQYELIRDNPGRVANLTKPLRGRESEDEQLVTYEADALKIRIDKNGKDLTVLTGFDLPIRSLDRIFPGTGVLGQFNALIGVLHPTIKIIPEVVSGKDFFTGRDLDRIDNQLVGKILDNKYTPKGLLDYIGWAKTEDPQRGVRYSFDGVRFYMLFRSHLLSRFLTSTDRWFDSAVKEGNWGPAWLDMLTGLRLKTLNLDEQQQRKAMQRIRILEDAAVRRGFAKEFKRVYTPKDKPEIYPGIEGPQLKLKQEKRSKSSASKSIQVGG